MFHIKVSGRVDSMVATAILEGLFSGIFNKSPDSSSKNVFKSFTPTFGTCPWTSTGIAVRDFPKP
jgi:hypothetical protein